MKDHSTHEIALIADTIAGEVNGDDAACVEQWVAANPDRLLTVTELTAAKIQLRSQSARSATHGSASRVIEQVLSAIGSAHNLAHTRPHMRHQLSHGQWFPKTMSRYVVFLVTLLIVAIPTIFVAVGGTRASTHTANTEQEYVTGAAERVTIELADGSRITLAPQSRLTYGIDRTQRRRAVLDGRALFHVQPRSNQPFIVEARNSVVQVLGTEFVVSSYAFDSVIQVAVRSGKVALRTSATREATGVALAAGDLGTLDGEGLVTVVRVADIRQYMSWAGERLQFTKAPLAVIAQELSLKYGIQVDVDTSLANVLVTASFSTEPVADALASLAAGVRGKIVGGSGRYHIVP